MEEEEREEVVQEEMEEEGGSPPPLLVQTEAAVRAGEAMPAAWGQTMSVRPNQAKPNQCLVCTRSSQGQGGGGEGSDLDLQRDGEQAGN